MHDRSHSQPEVSLKNFHYEHDIRYTLQMCQWVLKSIGMWPFIYSQTSRLEQIVSIGLVATCVFGLCFILVPTGVFIFFTERNLYMKVKLFGPFGFCMSALIKYCCLGFKGTLFGRCIDYVENDWRKVEDPDHRSIMLKHVATSRHLITVCAVFLYAGGMLYHTVMQLLSKERINQNFTVRPLAYPCYDGILDTQVTPVYEIVFSVHCFCAMIMYSVTTAAYSLAAVFVTHISGQIQILIARLDDLVDTRLNKDVRRDPLAVIVRDHVKILRFSKSAEVALREICLAEIVQSTISICLLEYYCLTEWQNSDIITVATYVILLISFIFNVLIFCYIGEILSDQCSQIGPASYEIKWYNLPARKANDLILLNAMSLYPPKLTAGKIFSLSLNTFSSVLKTSLAYFNLLRTMTSW